MVLESYVIDDAVDLLFTFSIYRFNDMYLPQTIDCPLHLSLHVVNLGVTYFLV